MPFLLQAMQDGTVFYSYSLPYIDCSVAIAKIQPDIFSRPSECWDSPKRTSTHPHLHMSYSLNLCGIAMGCVRCHISWVYRYTFYVAIPEASEV